MVLPPRWIPILVMMAAAPALAAQQGRLVAETEPNNTPATASVVQLGDTMSGLINQHADVDFFAIDIPAGAKVQLTIVARAFCHGLSLIDRDGTSALVFGGCFQDNGRPNDSLYTTISTAGRYYVRIIKDDDLGHEHPPVAYKIRLGRYAPPQPGPGNPMRLVTSAVVGEIVAMVAAPNGDLLVSARTIDTESHEVYRLWRVRPDGQATTFATGFNANGQIAVDAFGDLLVPSPDQGGVVWRYNLTTGARTVFTAGSYHAITVGADGDVWLAHFSISGRTIDRFDALGVPKGSLDASVRVLGLTTSQSGELFFLARGTGDVYKLVGNATPQRVITAPSFAANYGNYGIGPGSVALDQDGWVYLIQPRQGKLLLFNAQYQLARDPLAQVLDSLHWVDKRINPPAPAWMRDANGKMTSRMLVARGSGFYESTYGPNDILEINHAGMGAPGADPGLHLDLAALRPAGLTAAYADTFRLAGSSGSATWSVISGQLPPGLTLTATTGVLAGTPTETGTFDFAVKAVNGPRAGFGRFTIAVGSAPPVQVAVNDIANALMGGTTLSADVVNYLDSHGNNNGVLDVGDLRAYVRAQGLLSGSRKP